MSQCSINYYLLSFGVQFGVFLFVSPFNFGVWGFGFGCFALRIIDSASTIMFFSKSLSFIAHHCLFLASHDCLSFFVLLRDHHRHHHHGHYHFMIIIMHLMICVSIRRGIHYGILNFIDFNI